MANTVYILYSKSKDRYYIGQTQDLANRLNEHNSGESKSTKTGVPWIVVYTKEFQTRSEAMIYENQLKSLKNRKIIEELIHSG
ncbi:MAG: GIY-YIG nuclease family protein [Candidatus Marinimicrobia bacterium]|nr:GIY-YIG nuclease family protein [Candidatus Neomarinimicrobiota bacterium]